MSFDIPFQALQKARGRTLSATHPLYAHANAQLQARLQDIKQSFHRPLLWESFDQNPRPQEGWDLILSCLSLQHAQDLVPVFKAIFSQLSTKGLFLGVTLGGESLYELREVLGEAELSLTSRAHPRLAPCQNGESLARAMLESGFSLPVVDRARLFLTYDDMFALMNDLRNSGCANALNGRAHAIPPRKLFEKAATLYKDRFSLPAGGIKATLDLFFLHGWREE
ncbi:MAG: hypothetical protein FWF24_02560 [Alphaproteobacteria bacterium]|nr:hypothetical protein [Alphaproteobacteria bacterium]